MGYIYMLKSPSGKIYIGQTTRSIQERFGKHQYKSNCSAIYNAIQYHSWDNFEKDWYECPDEDLDFDEELLVREMGTLAPGGYNLREGGGSHGKMSGKTKQKISEAKQGENHPMYGKTLSEEHKQKIGEAQRGDKSVWRGKTHTNDSKQKMSEAKRGENHPMFGKNHTKGTKQKQSEAKRGEKNHMSKRVYQYDLEGKLLGSFRSVAEAARYLNIKDGSSIGECARGNRRCKTAYNFKWSYESFSN
jgi:hypothetical protein